MPTHSRQFVDLVRRGAEHRLRQLEAEIASLMKVFPHLRYGSAVSPAIPDPVEEAPIRRRPRRRMSAAAKKAASARMKAYWAKRRKASQVGKPKTKAGA